MTSTRRRLLLLLLFVVAIGVYGALWQLGLRSDVWVGAASVALMLAFVVVDEQREHPPDTIGADERNDREFVLVGAVGLLLLIAALVLQGLGVRPAGAVALILLLALAAWVMISPWLRRR